MIPKPSIDNRHLSLGNLDDMAHLARILVRHLVAGDFVALTGDLGSGKTTFVQLLGKAIGFDGTIASPTFTLINEYPLAHVTVLHGDLYRLDGKLLEDYLPVLEDRMATGNNMLLLEWADKAPQLKPMWTWHLHFESGATGETSRQVTVWTCRQGFSLKDVFPDVD